MLTRVMNRRPSAVGSAVLAVVMSLIVAPVPSLARADHPQPPLRGALSVITTPAGAAVYVDGKLEGQSPLTLNSIAAGEHRVRIVLEGYLENSRVVPIEADRPQTIQVTLTPLRAGANPAPPALPGGKLLTNKWFLLAVGVGVTAAIVVANQNSAPSIDGITALPATGLAAGSAIAFSAVGARDSEDGSADMRFNWDFGDGTRETTTLSQTTHVYLTPGAYPVKVSITDSGGKQSGEVSTAVTVRDLTSQWGGNLSVFNATVQLSQSGSALSGTYADQSGTGVISGTINTATPRITFTVSQAGFPPFTFVGDPDAGVNSLIGVVNGSGFVNQSWALIRK